MHTFPAFIDGFVVVAPQNGATPIGAMITILLKRLCTSLQFWIITGQSIV